MRNELTIIAINLIWFMNKIQVNKTKINNLTHIPVQMELKQHLADRGKRLGAYVIDIIPIGLIIFAIAYFFFGFDDTLSAYLNRGESIEPRIKFLKERNWIRNISFLVWLIYCIGMESSERQGTFGKIAMGIKVVNENGERMTINESIGRNTSKTISFIVLSLGFIWILFDKNRQGWHDKINNTFVVNENFNP